MNWSKGWSTFRKLDKRPAGESMECDGCRHVNRAARDRDPNFRDYFESKCLVANGRMIICEVCYEAHWKS